MILQRRATRRAITWAAVLLIFVILLALANRFTDGEQFFGVAPVVVVAIAVLGLLGLYGATPESELWRVRTRHVAVMTIGAALYAFLAYLFNESLRLQVGPVGVRPQICIPILLGYSFTPVVGFFTGAVGSLMGDFVTGWGVFPAWHIGSGLMGVVPGLVKLVPYESRNLRYLSTVVVVTLGVAASVVFIHPRAAEPWTGQVQDFSLWAWLLLIGGLVMVANSFLLEEVSFALAAINLWGTLGIIVGNGFTSLAHIWINDYGLASAVIGEFAPGTATDVLNLMIFAPLVLAGYNAVRRTRR